MLGRVDTALDEVENAHLPGSVAHSQKLARIISVVSPRLKKTICWNGSIHLGIVTVVWNSFSGADGRDSDRLM